MGDKYDELLPENIRYAVSPPELEDLSRRELYSLAESGGRDAKNAAILSLQQAVDAQIDGRIQVPEYKRIKDEAAKAVSNYYNGENVDPVYIPEVNEISTRQSGFLTHESPVRHFPNRIEDYENIDVVAPIASGGLEPGILASEELDADLSILRYSTNDFNDEKPIDIEEDYQDKRVLVVDDTMHSGDTLRTVEEHIRDRDPLNVESEAVIEGKLVGTATVFNSYLKDLRDSLTT